MGEGRIRVSNVFKMFYLTAPEDCVGITATLMAMVAEVDNNPGKYDQRLKPILVRIGTKVAETAQELVEAGDLLKIFEREASGQWEIGRLESEIAQYLVKRPL